MFASSRRRGVLMRLESFRIIVAVIAASFFIGTLACARRNVSLNTPQNVLAPSPQKILAAQPDFVADEMSGDFELLRGTTFTFKSAKKGEWYRTASDLAATFSSAQEADVRYFLKAKTFDLPPRNRPQREWHANAQFPAILALDESVTFETVGNENVDGHSCAKIRATKRNGDD